MSESTIQNQIMIELSKHGNYVLRVNSGTFWGGEIISHSGDMLLLKHPTRVMGAPAGTSDVIGCRTVVITPEMVGKTFAQFCALEIKRPGEAPKKHQERYLALMRSRGAVAGAATSPQEALALWTR